MQSSTVAHTVCLHRVRLPDRDPCGSGCGDTSILPAKLEPIVVIAQRDSSSVATKNKQSVVEQCAPLRAVLGWFCRPLLMRQGDLATQPSAAGRHELCWADATSPVSEEGVFVQVPSRSFIMECAHAAASGKAMDVVLYNCLSSRQLPNSDSTSGRVVGDAGEGCGDNTVGGCDEGYVYGFAQFVTVGHATEGLLLAAFSVSPLFNTLRTVVFEALPHVVRVVREMRTDPQTAWRGEDLTVMSAVCTDVMLPLADLVDAQSAICKTPAKRHFYLRFPHTKKAIFRPDDSHFFFIDVPLTTLFLSFSYDALRVIYSLLLQEKRIVFIGATPQHASACVVSAQAMLIPFVWTLPIVPYAPPDASDVLEVLKNNGFILGSTADMVPRLMLRGSLPRGRSRIYAG